LGGKKDQNRGRGEGGRERIYSEPRHFNPRKKNGMTGEKLGLKKRNGKG